MNRRVFLSSLGLGFLIPLAKAAPEPEVVVYSPESVVLTEEEYPHGCTLEAINQGMIRYRKLNGKECQPRILLLGTRQREDCLNLCWQGSVTREFAARATKEDYYRISHDYLHDEIRAGRGELFGLKLCWDKRVNHFEVI